MGVFEPECDQVYLLQRLTPRFGEGKAGISSLMQGMNIREAERIVLTYEIITDVQRRVKRVSFIRFVIRMNGSGFGVS